LRRLSDLTTDTIPSLIISSAKAFGTTLNHLADMAIGDLILGDYQFSSAAIHGMTHEDKDATIQTLMTVAGGVAGARVNGALSTEAEALAVPGRVQSRINLSNEGMDHLEARHLSGKDNASQFTISSDEVRSLLQSKTVVNTPVTKIISSGEESAYVREVNVGRTIGTDKFNSFKPTSTMTVITDKFGDLQSAFPGVLK